MHTIILQCPEHTFCGIISSTLGVASKILRSWHDLKWITKTIYFFNFFLAHGVTLKIFARYARGKCERKLCFGTRLWTTLLRIGIFRRSGTSCDGQITFLGIRKTANKIYVKKVGTPIDSWSTCLRQFDDKCNLFRHDIMAKQIRKWNKYYK